MTNKEAIKNLQKKLNEDAYYYKITGRKITDPYYKYNVIKTRLSILYAIKALRDADKKAPSVSPSLILDNITEDYIKNSIQNDRYFNGKTEKVYIN